MDKIMMAVLEANRMLRLPLFLCVIIFPVLAHGAEVTESEVRTAVQTWVRHVTADAKPDAAIEKMEPYTVDGRAVGYIAHLSGKGFCLCGADDLALPVYWYSPEGVYDAGNPHYQYILWEIATRVKNLRRGLKEGDAELQKYKEALSDRRLFWQDLISGSISAKADVEPLAPPAMMELPLTCTWSQGSPYNDQCPVLPSPASEQSVVGCGATATSQIMYYWKWPITGESSGSTNYNYRWRSNWDEEPLASDPNIPANWGGGGRLEWTSASGGRLRMNGFWDGSVYQTARAINKDTNYQNALLALYNRLTPVTVPYSVNFAATAYQWGLMKDIHTDPPDTGDAAVATLCYHAGVALEMDYGIWFSGTPSFKLAPALYDHFRYDTDAVRELTVDINKMTEEIQWLRPLLFCGSNPDTGAGHFWVVFGYNKATDPDRQFRMNMGWGGGSDGWYSLDSVPNNLTYAQHHVTRIAPENVVRFVGASDAGDGSPDDPHENIEEALTSAPDGATVIFMAGSDNTFVAPALIINKPLTLKGKDVAIRKQ